MPDHPTGTRKTFHDLPIGSEFHDGITRGAGANSARVMYHVWRKIKPAQAECIGQVGYGNTRAVGTWKWFGAQAAVWQLESAS